MYRELDGIGPPNDEDTLWRYMSFEQFVNMLDTESLFYTRAYKFEDPFEGFFSQMMTGAYQRSVKKNPTKEIEDGVIKLNEIMHKCVMCNCWHKNEDESMAMWEKYRFRNSGIAIKTTMLNLKNSISDTIDFFIGRIAYISREIYDERYYFPYDQKSDLPLGKMWLYHSYFAKRMAFEYEQEVRIIIDIDTFVGDILNELKSGAILDSKDIEFNFPDIDDQGRPYNVDVNALIDEVIISPYAECWIEQTVRSVVHKYGFNFEVNPSTLLDVPTLDETTD